MISSSREHIIGNRNYLSVSVIDLSTEPISEEQVTHHGLIGFLVGFVGFWKYYFAER